MPRRAVRRLWIVLGVGVVVCLAGPKTGGQVGAPPGGVVIDLQGDMGQAHVHPPTDRQLSRGMRRAQESISQGEYSQALRFLDEVLGRDEDYFTETGDVGGFAGLKETARRLIASLPPEGRRAYESAFGPIAERQLKSALASGDADACAAVAQRYFYTAAGYQAALVWAADEADAGRFFSAALLYQQLLDTPEAVKLFEPTLSIRAAASWLAADDADQAQRILQALGERGRTSIEIAGRSQTLDSADDPLEWVRRSVGEPNGAGAVHEHQWLTYRGNAARNAEADGGLPHMRVRWKVRLMNHPRLEELFDDYQADAMQSGGPTPVAGAPLAVGDYVLVRTLHGLLAVDFRTGKRVWRSEQRRDEKLEQLVRSGSAGEADLTDAAPAWSFARRVWEDYLYGIASSDGARAYVVRDLPMPAAQTYDSSPFMSFTGPEPVAPSNRLTAYDLGSEGTLAWEIDGATAANVLRGAFFLGAPLAIGSSVYALLEIRDDIYLAALDQETGALQWRQQLANLETGVLVDLSRRLQSAMPSYDGGMLICPTGAGAVVGVNLTQRSLAWAYRYDTVPPMLDAYRAGPESTAHALANRWTEGVATIAGGRVLLTPPESNELHCLDLLTGRLLWKKPRGEMLRLAGVFDDRILLVGQHRLSALRLDDGAAAWEQGDLDLPRDAAPSGQGFVSDGKYYLPLTTAEVVAVDLSTGRIASRARSRDGAALGNLICYRGAVISQNGLFLDCFDQVDALREHSQQQLADDPENVEALRSLGEIAFNEGRLSEAIDLEERAYRQAPDDLETRDMLAECLAAALDEDFVSYRAQLPLLKQLAADGATGELQVLRIEAQGRLSLGDRQGAAAACFELYAAARDAHEPLAIGRDHETAASRWVQSHMLEIWESATPDERASIGGEIRRLSAGLDAPGGGDGLERFLAFFAALPELDELKLSRARQLDAELRMLESQQLLLDLAASSVPAVRREAVARIAMQLHGAKLHSLARDYDRLLADELADEPCLDGATGSEVVARWVDAAAETSIDWPTGRVEVRNVAASGGSAAARTRGPVWNVQLEHTDSILGAGVGFLAARGELSWHDNYGREFFTATLESELQLQYRQSGGASGISRGNLLVVSMGRELAAFNTLPSAEGPTVALAWRASLGSNFDEQAGYLGEMNRSGVRRPGSYRPPRSAMDGKWIGVVGPLTSGGCVFQDQRRLICVDPTSGEALWWRTDAPLGADLFGDDRYVFVTPLGGKRARVYSAIDGRALGSARVPPWDQQLTTRGRLVIRWHKNEGGNFELSALDPLTQEISWRHEFGRSARIDIGADRYIAAVEPEGRAAVIDAATGAVELESTVPPQPSLEQVHLLVGSGEFTLVLQHAGARNTNRVVHPFNPSESPVVDGVVIALDRARGVARWSRPADLVQQSLLAHQPADLPLIAFAGMLRSKERGDASATTTMLLVDKATGRTLFSADDLPQAGAGFCMAHVSNAKQREIVIDLVGRSIQLTFTDQRRPPEPPALADVESPGDKASRGLMGIFRNLGGAQ